MKMGWKKNKTLNFVKANSLCGAAFAHIADSYKSITMKYLLIISLMVLSIVACSKKTSNDNSNCAAVEITQSGTPCGSWGIKSNGNVYPSTNIPTQFQQEGITVCADYDLYQDTRACACCGGTWADIKSMKTYVR